MLITALIFLLCVLSNSADSIDGYCDAKTETCSELNEKYILYDVNPPEGFNLRRDVYMRFAIMLAEAKKHKNWKLVLPPWYNMYHWKSERILNPIPWNRFFDLKSLKSFAPVLEMYEVFNQSTGNLVIDRLYLLQNFPNAFEDGDFSDKWEIVGECEYDENLWGYKNITVTEVVCVRFQGRISKLWEVMAVHPFDKTIMFAHGEIPLHDHYGTKTFWDCRKSMKFNTDLVKTAKKYVLKHFNCHKNCPYVSIHWRRQDFVRSRRNDIPSIKGTVKQINDAIMEHNPNIIDVFVASDGTNSELISLEKQLYALGYKIHFYIPTRSELDRFGDGEVAVIDQIICSYAAYFIGTYESTFTYRIQEEREILGFDSSTTFNRFCPDTGNCEKPSQWTIVN